MKTIVYLIVQTDKVLSDQEQGNLKNKNVPRHTLNVTLRGIKKGFR